MVVGIRRLASFIRQSQLITVIRRSRLSINTVVGLLMRPRGSSSCYYYRIIIVSLDSCLGLDYEKIEKPGRRSSIFVYVGRR